MVRFIKCRFDDDVCSYATPDFKFFVNAVNCKPKWQTLKPNIKIMRFENVDVAIWHLLDEISVIVKAKPTSPLKQKKGEEALLAGSTQKALKD